jgi:KDO2-lipid IV(A) lauroyltransferase|tara:strand:+ start:2292 stop:3194 length:903 start_codon:yes stop_codon:yes gene_type:complete
LGSGAVAGYRLGSTLARLLPDRVGGPAARLLGRLAGHLNPGRRSLVARNLERTRRHDTPQPTDREVSRSVDAVFASYADYWYRSFRLPGMSVDAIDAGFSQDGYEHIVEARRSGTGPIMALPHLGCWEWAAFWLARVNDLPVSAVVEAIEPPELFEWFRSYRASLGMDIITLGPSAGSDVVRAIRANHVVCLPCDRHVGGAGVEVEFFGETTTLPAGPATLALRTGAALLPVAIYDNARGCHAIVRPPIPTERTGRLRHDVERVTRLLAAELEDLIRLAPEQWHLLQPNWPSDRVTDPAG